MGEIKKSQERVIFGPNVQQQSYAKTPPPNRGV